MITKFARSIARHIKAVYRIPVYRFAYTQMRLLVRTAGGKTFDRLRHKSNPRTVSHNLKSLRAPNIRNEKLLLASMCIEDIEAGKSLIIGCRTEEEIFLFRGYGFKDVTAVDLISYSPLVLEADMHEMPFPNDSFDFIFCAYTLSYSQMPSRAAKEFVRVLKDGGHIAIAVEYTPWEERREIQESLLGYTIIPDEKLETTRDIVSLFGDRVKKVLVDYDAERKRHHTASGLVERPSPVMVVFSVRKDAAGTSALSAR